MRWLRKLFAPKPKRAELKFVPYSEADALLAAGWKLAPEEDHNRQIGMVYLERLDFSATGDSC